MLNLMKLESRIVLDGAGLGEAADHAEGHDAQGNGSGNGQDHIRDYGTDHAQSATVAEAAALLADSAETPSSESLDIVIVSDILPDYDKLVEAAKQKADEVVVYDAKREPADQVVKRVTELSEERGRPVTSLTVLSHGEEGSFKFGNEEISVASIQDNSRAWAELDTVMAGDGHIYIYGCNVGDESEESPNLLDRLAEATGAKVFASDDITGKDGDWNLESASEGANADEADPPMDVDALAGYEYNLTAISVPAQIASFEDQPGSYGIFIYGEGESAGSRTDGSVDLAGSISSLFTSVKVEYNGWITNDPRTIDGQLVSAYHRWTVDFDPVQNQSGQATLNFNIDGTSFDTLVTVLPVNDPPIAYNDSIVTPEDTPITDALEGDDPVEGDPIIFEIVTHPEHGTITDYNPNTGQYTYGPDPDYFGPDGFTFRVNDGQSRNNLSQIATVDITVSPVPDKPEVETSEGNAEYIENDLPLVVDPSVEVSDADNETLTGATVQISRNYQNDARGQDILRFSDQSGIAGTWQPGTGTLTLTGTATPAQYQAALRTVSYEHIGGLQDGDDPNENVRTVVFTVTDASGLTSDSAARGVFVNAINDAPELNPQTGIITYVEKCGPIRLGDDFQVDDVDDENMTRADIQITEGYIPGEDVLQFNDTANITGSWNSATGTLTLTGPASESAYAAAFGSVTYNNTGNEVDPGSRQLTLTIQDANSRGLGEGPAGGSKTDSVTRTLEMEINDPPVLDLDSTDGTPPFDFEAIYTGSVDQETGGKAVPVTDQGVFSDLDDTELSQLRVQITNKAEGDVLEFDTSGTDITGSYNSETGVLLLTGVDSIQNYEQVLNTIGFLNVNHILGDEQIFDRRIEFQARDNQGGTCVIKDSNVAVATVTVLPGPSLEEPEPATFIEGRDPVSIAEDVELTSPDENQIESLVVTISNVQTGDILEADVSGTNITKSYVGGVLTLDGVDTAENYERVLHSITFENSSDSPNPVQRIIHFQVTDSEGLTGETQSIANVVPVNDAPVNEFPGRIFAPINTSIALNNISISDVDAGDGEVLVTLRSDFGVIQVAGDGSGAEIISDGGSTVTIEGTVAQVNAALQGLSYTPPTDFQGEDRLTITVNDQGRTGVHPTENVRPDFGGLIGIDLTDDGQVPSFPDEGTPQDPTALEDQDIIVIQVTESDTDVVTEMPGTPNVPFLPITRPEAGDVDGIELGTVRLPGPSGITEGVGRPLFEARALAGRDYYDFCSIEESLRSHLGCRFAHVRNPEAQFGSIAWEDFTDLGWIPPYEHLDEEYNLYSRLFIREEGDPGFNVEANEFQRDLGGLAEQAREVFEEKAGREGFNELDSGEGKRTFLADREHLDKTGR